MVLSKEYVYQVDFMKNIAYMAFLKIGMFTIFVRLHLLLIENFSILEVLVSCWTKFRVVKNPLQSVVAFRQLTSHFQGIFIWCTMPYIYFVQYNLDGRDVVKFGITDKPKERFATYRMIIPTLRVIKLIEVGDRIAENLLKGMLKDFVYSGEIIFMNDHTRAIISMLDSDSFKDCKSDKQQKQIVRFKKNYSEAAPIISQPEVKPEKSIDVSAFNQAAVQKHCALVNGTKRHIEESDLIQRQEEKMKRRQRRLDRIKELALELRESREKIHMPKKTNDDIAIAIIPKSETLPECSRIYLLVREKNLGIYKIPQSIIDKHAKYFTYPNSKTVWVEIDF